METVTISVNHLIGLAVLVGMLSLPLFAAGVLSLVVVWKQLSLVPQGADEQKPNPNNGDKP